MMLLLVADGANIEEKDNNGWTPFHASCSIPNLLICQRLLELGVDVTGTHSILFHLSHSISTVKNNMGDTPLHLLALAKVTRHNQELFKKVSLYPQRYTEHIVIITHSIH
jgi:ankyrin repeat protein